MSTLLRALAGAALFGLALIPALSAQAQPADIYWSDHWNFIFHQFSDLDGDGTYLGAGEVSHHIGDGEPGTNRPRDLRTTIENGELVSYWLHTTGDLIVRGVDSNGNGLLAGNEVTTFRDSGALDGDSIPSGLDITDDGAVWWTSVLLISQPQNGLARLEDLNGDGDAADPGEQILMVDGNSGHTIEHDLGTAEFIGWSMQHIAAVGDGIMAYAGNDHALYRFDDLNKDGDVLDAGESILLLNASGERADLPMNPDFADGTLKNLQTPAGYPTQFNYIASAMENGLRVFYFGTTASPFNTSGANLLGQGLNFIIFRGIDGNGDGDVNDAGEVRAFFDGSSTDGDPELILLRGLDVLDGGTLYAVEIKPFPALFPGPDGNAWIHRFEDLNGDGDAHDVGELQLGVFDLQIHGHSPEFPNSPAFGNVMADAWDFSVRRLTQWTDMGGASPGSNGTPTLSGSGSLVGGTTAAIDLVNATPGALMLSWLSFSAAPTSALGGTLYAFPFSSQGAWVADGAGNLSLSTAWPVGFPAGTDAWLQFIVQDVGVPAGLTLSNAVKLTMP
jgi:hypothetical protein